MNHNLTIEQVMPVHYYKGEICNRFNFLIDEMNKEKYNCTIILFVLSFITVFVFSAFSVLVHQIFKAREFEFKYTFQLFLDAMMYVCCYTLLCCILNWTKLGSLPQYGLFNANNVDSICLYVYIGTAITLFLIYVIVLIYYNGWFLKDSLNTFMNFISEENITKKTISTSNGLVDTIEHINAIKAISMDSVRKDTSFIDALLYFFKRGMVFFIIVIAFNTCVAFHTSLNLQTEICKIMINLYKK
jgi:hypothetical protein